MEESPGVIALDVRADHWRRWYPRFFTGPEADADALAFCRQRAGTHEFREIDIMPLNPRGRHRASSRCFAAPARMDCLPSTASAAAMPTVTR
jgi:hypothetical protein